MCQEEEVEEAAAGGGGSSGLAVPRHALFQKAPQVWTDGGDRDHLDYVAQVLVAQGWPVPEILAETTRSAGPLGWLGGKGDPFFAVIASQPLTASTLPRRR